jgi:hypothetical protein
MRMGTAWNSWTDACLPHVGAVLWLRANMPMLQAIRCNTGSNSSWHDSFCLHSLLTSTSHACCMRPAFMSSALALAQPPSVQIAQCHDLLVLLRLLTGAQNDVAVVERKAYDLLHIGDDLLVAQPADTPRQVRRSRRRSVTLADSRLLALQSRDKPRLLQC